MDVPSGQVKPSDAAHTDAAIHEAELLALREREKFAIEQECRREASHRDHPVHHVSLHLDGGPTH